MKYVNFILKVQSKFDVIMYTDVAVISDGRFGRGSNSGFLQFSWCPHEYSHVKYCDFEIQFCSSSCPENYHQFGLRCYGKSININIIYTVYVLYNTIYTGNWYC